MKIKFFLIFLLLCGFMQAQIVHLPNLKSFKDHTKDGYTVVFFWAKWSGPSKMQAIAFDKAFNDLNSKKPRFAKVDVDKCEDIVQNMGIKDVPMIFFIKDGTVAHSVHGYIPADRLKMLFDKYHP